MAKINYAPGTVMIVKFEHPLIRVQKLMATSILSKSKNLLIVKNGIHGNVQDEFSMPTCCDRHKEIILSILN